MPGFEWAEHDPDVTERALHTGGTERGNHIMSGREYIRFSLRPLSASRAEWVARWDRAFGKGEAENANR